MIRGIAPESSHEQMIIPCLDGESASLLPSCVHLCSCCRQNSEYIIMYMQRSSRSAVRARHLKPCFCGQRHVYDQLREHLLDLGMVSFSIERPTSCEWFWSQQSKSNRTATTKDCFAYRRHRVNAVIASAWVKLCATKRPCSGPGTQSHAPLSGSNLKT